MLNRSFEHTITTHNTLCWTYVINCFPIYVCIRLQLRLECDFKNKQICCWREREKKNIESLSLSTNIIGYVHLDNERHCLGMRKQLYGIKFVFFLLLMTHFFSWNPSSLFHIFVNYFDEKISTRKIKSLLVFIKHQLFYNLTFIRLF